MKEIPPPRQDFEMYVARPETRWTLVQGDPLELVYASGYLPYSGARGIQNVFYSARSARVVLGEFTPSSENRRIAKKFDGKFTKTRVPFADFKPDEQFFDFCLAYFSQKHSERAMPRERLETILQSGLITTVICYQQDSRPVAYVLEVGSARMGHYWFSFYDLAYARQSLGLWLMLDAVKDAKASGKEYYYLGTVYGPHALYKTNFEPLQWWSGAQWSADIAALKRAAKEE